MPSSNPAAPAASDAIAAQLSEVKPVGPAQQVHTEFGDITEHELLPVLHEVINEQRDLINQADQIVRRSYQSLENAQQAEDPVAFFGVYTQHNQAFSDLIASRYNDPTAHTYARVFARLGDAIDTLVRCQPVWHTEVQHENRFVRLADDSWRVGWSKFFKRQRRAAAYLPGRLRNLFRRGLGRAAIPQPVATYRVPLRNLVQHFYQEEWAVSTLSILEEVNRHLVANTHRLWQFEDRAYTLLYTHLSECYATGQNILKQLPELPQDEYEATITELRQALDDLEATTSREVKNQLAVFGRMFAHAYERVGTVELPTRRFGHRSAHRHRRRTTQELSANQGWRNTLYALYEDWRIDQEINLLCARLFDEHAQLRQTFRQKIQDAVGPHVDRIISCIDEIEAAVLAADRSGTEMKRVLRQQREVVDFRLIRTIIPAAVATLYREALPATVAGVYQRGQVAVEALADKRALVSTTDYDQPLKPSDMNYISPRQIVSFESLPKLRAAIEETKGLAGQRIAEIQKIVAEIGQVSYFNLDSALALYESGEDAAAAPDTATEGLARARKHALSVKEKLEETYEQVDVALREAIQQSNTELVALKQNDYALEIKLRLAKAKALERTQALKQRWVNYGKHAIPQATHYTQQQYRQLASTVQAYRQRIGITNAEAGVTTEVSDFLNDTETAINRLPYVYQRLYANRPLEETVFYEERSTELTILQKAYRNWSQGRYASTVLVGERGAGATTLANFFVKKLQSEVADRYEVVRVTSAGQISTEAELLTFVNAVFPDITLRSWDEVVGHLNDRERKLIVVWEGIQHLYLRKVGGFAALKRLFELISRTHRRVFWVCACTQYAWDFLDKTIGIAEYYEYIISLKEVSSQQLKEAILKRHRVSGYQIRYTGVGRDRLRKKFAKMTDEQQQTYLEEVYFEDLKKLSAGNYSIAQLYWLRSTQQVHDDTITINSLQRLDFSFTQSLSLPRMLILHNLLLHDGLSAAHFDEIGERVPGKRSANRQLELMQLCDDGLITCQEGTYAINPLLYRQTVQLLRNKNFLH